MLDLKDLFVRELDVDLGAICEPLKLYQKLEGDVNCIVWDAAIVLAKYLEKLHNETGNFLVGSSLVELGAGVGCVGLMAACLGANVILTDLPEALPIIKHNINENSGLFTRLKGCAEAVELKWGDENGGLKSPDWIIMADCIYYKESIEPLITTLLELSGPSTQILQAQEMRDSDKQKDVWNFYMEKLKNVFVVEEIEQREQNSEYSSSDIKLYRIKRNK